MNKRYWFVVASYNSSTQTGEMNMGFVSDDENPFTNEAIKKAFRDSKRLGDVNQLVVVNFIEFKNETDYVNFWKRQ